MNPFSGWIERDLPAVDTPFEGLEGRLLSSPHGQAVFFRAARDTEVPPHAHGSQWGVVVAGTLELTIGGETRTYEPGRPTISPPEPPTRPDWRPVAASSTCSRTPTATRQSSRAGAPANLSGYAPRVYREPEALCPRSILQNSKSSMLSTKRLARSAGRERTARPRRPSGGSEGRPHRGDPATRVRHFHEQLLFPPNGAVLGLRHRSSQLGAATHENGTRDQG